MEGIGLSIKPFSGFRVPSHRIFLASFDFLQVLMVEMEMEMERWIVSAPEGVGMITPR